jgi:ribosome maturation factor RimP
MDFFMEKIDVVARVTEMAEPLAASLGLELVEVEYRQEGRQMVLRLYIDRDGGVTLDDCSAVSRELTEILDVEDLIQGHYNLEVSSPGLNRPLKKPSDFESHTGRLVKIRTFEPLADDAGNLRKTFLGELLGLSDSIVRLKLNEGQTASIPLGKVAKANLEFEF